MLIIVTDNPQGVYLADLKPYQVETIMLSIGKARKCEFQAMKELALVTHIPALCFTAREGPVLSLTWDHVVFLMSVLVYLITEKISRETILLYEIIEALTCAMEMKMSAMI